LGRLCRCFGRRCGRVSPAGKIRAARTLLELGLKAAGDDFDERLALLEEAWQASETEQPALRILKA
jgi:hypothetical protein